MKIAIVLLAAIATVTGATVAAATAPKAEPESLDRIEEEIFHSVDAKLRDVLAGFQVG